MFDAFEKTNYQDEYRSLLEGIKPLIRGLKNAKDAKLCALWLSKLDQAERKESAIRNELLRQLKACVLKKRLIAPFTDVPDSVPLSVVMKRVPQKRGAATVADHNDTLYSITCDEIIGKYKERSRKYKSTLSHYQTVLKDLIDLSTEETGRSGVEMTCSPRQSECQCAEPLPVTVTVSPPPASVTQPPLQDFLKRMNALEQEVNELRLKSAERIKKHDKKKRQQKSTILERCNTLISRTENTIREAEKEIRDQTMHSLNAQHSELEQTVLDKCDMLEKNYQKMMEDATEKHQTEQMKSRQTIEKLQSLLLTSGTRSS